MQVLFKICHSVICLLTIFEPIWNLDLTLSEPLIKQNDRTIVIDMSNHSANSLIDSSLSLQCIPSLPIHLAVSSSKFPVKEVLLDEYFWVKNLRIWDARHDYSSGCIICKIDAFCQFAPAHSKESRFAFLLNCSQIFVQHLLILDLILVLNVYVTLFLNLLK